MGDTVRETRNRSRSKTPFLRSQCDSESCAHAGEEGHIHHHHEKKKKTPNVQTIIEESVEVTKTPTKESKKSTTKSTITSISSTTTSTSVTKDGGKRTITSDYSSEDVSPETVSRQMRSNADNSSSQGIAMHQSSYSTSSTTTSTVVSTSAQRIKENKNFKNISTAAMTSTPKAIQQQSFSKVFGDNRDISQNASNSDFERSDQQNRSGNNSSSKNFFSEHSNGSLAEHIAYKEYKDAGEYWNKFPKTDYTYSKRSPHRREILPGVIAMPNMSRRSLENHNDRVTEMIQRDPVQEEYIRRRYAYQCTTNSNNSVNRKAAENLIYDSQDEVDLAQFESYRKSKRYLSSTANTSLRTESWFTRFITSVVTVFSSFWSSVTGGKSENDLYRTRMVHEQRGVFGRLSHGISSVFLGLFRYVYIAISSVLSLDTWLLRTSNAENRNKKRFLILLLLLLPLLLLAAWALLEEHERHTLILRAYNFLPFTLASLRNSIAGLDLKSLFTLPKLESSHYATTTVGGDVTSSLKKSLSPEEYENILNHVNAYVQKLVDSKLQQQVEQASKLKLEPTLSHEMLLTIANTVRQNVQKLEPIIVKKTQSDVLGENVLQRIAENVQLKLEESKWAPTAPVILSSDNLKEISNLIRENIAINNHQYNIVERIDIEDLLLKILHNPKLAAFIDSRISEVAHGSGTTENEIIARQELIINELGKEIEFIKTSLADKVSENDDLHYSINNLKLSQDELMKRFDTHEALVGDRFGSLLTEIEHKLSLLRDDQFALINKQVKLSLIDILGYKDTENIDNIDLQDWIRNTFVAKEFLEQKLTELSALANHDLKEEIHRSGMIMMRQISEKLKTEILRLVELKQKQSSAAISGEIKMALSENEIKKIVKSVLAVYDADKTGLVDYALESAGGQILSTRCTENYPVKTAQISIFGIPLWYPSNTPRIAISPNVQPGECWAFQGFPGFLVLRLNSLVRVTGFTLEHIPKTLTPNGRIDSAPRNFTVWGLEHENDHEPVLLGEYEYLDNNAPLQYFPVQNVNIDRLFDIVEMRIETNHGNPKYTCLYRFRVHGEPPTLDANDSKQ